MKNKTKKRKRPPLPPSPEWKLHGKVAPLMPSLPGMPSSNTSRSESGSGGRVATTRSKHKKARADGARTALELYELCLAMRRGDQLEVKDMYVRWRCVEQWTNIQSANTESLRGRLPKMILPDGYDAEWPGLLECAKGLAVEKLEARRAQGVGRKGSNKPIAELTDENQLSACVLYLDDYQEANIGIYEPHGCTWLDQNHPQSVSPDYKVRVWFGEGHKPRELEKERGRQGTTAQDAYPYEWAVLYFRQHVVIAHHPEDTSEIVVYNTAGMNFLDDAGDSKLLSFYSQQWQIMTEILWPASRLAGLSPSNATSPSSPPMKAAEPSGWTFNVVHLGVQGVNDCGIWTWLFPRIHLDATLHQLVDYGVQRKDRHIRRARGRAKDKGLDELFQSQILSVLTGHLGPEEKEKLAEMAASSKSMDQAPSKSSLLRRKAEQTEKRNKSRAKKFANEATRLGLEIGDKASISFKIGKEFRAFEGELKCIDHRGLEFYFAEDDTVTRFTRVPELELFMKHAESLKSSESVLPADLTAHAAVSYEV